MKQAIKYISWVIAAALGLAAVPVLAAHTSPGTVYVDDNCSLPANGTAADPFCTIQQGINHSNAGDTVQVAEGVYAESVNVGKRVKILGRQAGDSATNGWLPSGVESVVNPSSGPAFNLTANRIVIDGFRITGADGDSGIVTAANRSGYEVRNNMINSNTRGINLNSNGNIKTIVSRNLFDTNNVAGPGAGDAIRSVSGLRNAEISYNTFQNHANSAITLADSATHNNVKFHHNLSMNDATTVNWYRASNSRADHNDISGFFAPDYGAISLGGGNSNVTIDHNDISGRNSSGIVIVDYIGAVNTNLTIDHNDIFGSALDGIEVRASSTGGSVLITFNDANSNGRDGIRVDTGNSGLVINENDMSGNTNFDAHDLTVGGGTAGTANTWTSNDCVTDSPDGLC